MNQHDDTKPTPVAATPLQAGDTRAPWGWVERTVWTERRLTRLTSGEPADRVWYTLVDKTYAPANLASAFHKVWQNGGSAGADAQTVAHFAKHAEEELSRLAEQMSDGTYRPQPVRRAWIPKPGSREKRPLGIPAVRDRIVPGALRHVLEPIFETNMAEHSDGFRPGRGAKDALRRVDMLLKAGHVWVVDADHTPDASGRHDSARPVARAGNSPGGRRAGAGVGGKFPPGRSVGGVQRLATH